MDTFSSRAPAAGHGSWVEATVNWHRKRNTHGQLCLLSRVALPPF
jgi:hypothetical protein